MKKAEIKIFAMVGIGFALVVLFTVYLEQQIADKQQQRHAAKPEHGAVPDGPAVWVIPKGIIPASLPEPESRGATVLLLYCAQCHDLPTPAMHNPEEWTQVLQRMEKRIQVQRGGMLARILMPPENDWKVLLSYLQRFAQKPLEGNKLAALQQQTDWNSAESQSFQATCSVCHAMPDPEQHTAREWPRVVLRMKNNLRSARQKTPDDTTTERIIAYLQRHAKPAEPVTPSKGS
ncbi:MAG: hypothetical protein OEZ68_19570 [Gammaproteobacteria bacterium]|nr:hypothetical protein [Gammaproteobacteria bacterium]MDH5803009.1 hypothetical protein [Gammaproteobacteria bacterium]